MIDLKKLRKIDRANALVVAAVVVASAAFFSWKVTVGLAAGSLLMALDFYVLRRLAVRLISDSKSMVLSAVLLTAKLFGFFGVVALCVFYLPMNVLAFGAGATAIVATASIVGARLAAGT